VSKVSIVRCPDYSDTKRAIAEALDLLGGLENVIHSGDRVLLKPNILAASPPESAATTHPSIVASMCEFVLQAGGKPVVGDGAGISRPGTTSKALKTSGIEESARKAGAQVVNFETAGFTLVDIPDPLQFRKLYIANPVLEADVVISLPKLKTHELTYYTGAVKNFFGALPLKCRFQRGSFRGHPGNMVHPYLPGCVQGGVHLYQLRRGRSADAGEGRYFQPQTLSHSPTE